MVDHIERNELISQCQSLLSQREAQLSSDYWLMGDGEIDEGISYCEDCIHIAFYENMHHADGYTYAYPDGESDSPRTCERCGQLLDYVLTDYGVDDELDHFEDEVIWDWNDAADCYEMARVAYGAFTDEQKDRLYAVLLKGKNAPRDLVEHIR